MFVYLLLRALALLVQSQTVMYFLCMHVSVNYLSILYVDIFQQCACIYCYKNKEELFYQSVLLTSAHTIYICILDNFNTIRCEIQMSDLKNGFLEWVLWIKSTNHCVSSYFFNSSICCFGVVSFFK